MQNISSSPKIIGHRGVAGLRPENTYCSFSLAAALGVAWIEFDVQLTKDDQWAIMHDDTIDRTTNSHGKIRDYTLAQLEQIQAGLWFDPPYIDQTIPSLVKTFDLAHNLGLSMNIEIKGAQLHVLKHASLMAEFIKLYLKPKMQVLVSSFDLACIIALRNLMPKLAIGYLVDNFSADTIEITRTNKFNSINCDVNTITEKDLHNAQDNNIPVFLYTINDKATARFWLDKGVAGVFSDRADLLL